MPACKPEHQIPNEFQDHQLGATKTFIDTHRKSKESPIKTREETPVINGSNTKSKHKTCNFHF